MKIIGHTHDHGYIAEMSREEVMALCPRRYEEFEGAPYALDVDILARLRPTMTFEAKASSGPAMVARIREMADELEKGLAELRAANG